MSAERSADCYVRGDAGRLQQVFLNLLSNAVKFTPEGGAIEVTIHGDTGHALVHVRDSGQGISPELQPFIFERFRQGDNATTRRHGGLGLGLAIVRHLTEAHGGTVSVESRGKARERPSPYGCRWLKWRGTFKQSRLRAIRRRRVR